MDLNACIKTKIIKSVKENTGVNIGDLQFGQDLGSVTLGLVIKQKVMMMHCFHQNTSAHISKVILNKNEKISKRLEEDI